MLSEAPNESVLPLARVGARRLMEYLMRTAKEIAHQAPSDFLDFPLEIEVLLDAFMQGHCGRSAMRIIPQGQLSRSDADIYHREKALHKQEGNDKSYDWGRVKYVSNDKAKGPKYGYMYVNASTTEAYGYVTSKGGAVIPPKNKGC